MTYPGKAPIKLAGHFWFNSDARNAGRKCPAIVELLPYRRRDGTMLADAKMYPWFAYNDYLCFRVDLQGSGDSEGVLTDEYTDEELAYCGQVIEQIAARADCSGAVGMMGKSWSAINSLMMAARPDRPAALKAVIVCAGSDDRWNDDVHYMGGGMMFDNVSWPSSMFGWLAAAPDPAVVGDAWKEMWRSRIDNADFWFKPWGSNQPRDEYWSGTAVRDHYADVGVPVFILSGWQDGYKNPVPLVVDGLAAEGKEVAGIIGAWGHKYPFNGYPGPRVDWLDYIVTHWWDRWLKGKTPPRRGRLAAIAGVARRIERAEQIGLRRRHRQMGGRGRRLALARQAEGPLSAERQSPRRRARARDLHELRQAGARYRDAGDELLGRMRQ